MAVLLDNIINDRTLSITRAEVKGAWFIAKPLPYYAWYRLSKLSDAFLVLTNRAFAVQYAEDYFKKREPKEK